MDPTQKKGLERYRKSEAKYNEAKARVRSYKSKINSAFDEYGRELDKIEGPYKNGRSVLSDEDYKKELAATKKYYDVVDKAKQERSAARKEARVAKKEMKSDYKKLKTDYKADKGKELYSQGKTIGERATKDLLSYVGTVAATEALAAVANSRQMTISNKFGTIPVSSIIYGAGAAGVIAETVKYERDKANLRAYYGHH